LFILILLLVFCSSRVSAWEADQPASLDPNTLREKVATATRKVGGLTIDGKLDDEAWQAAEPIDAFLQQDPDNLAAPREKTVAWVVYDDRFFYVGIQCYQEPETIRARLARRDAWSDAAGNKADWAAVRIDSQNDDLNSKIFIVNAAGVQIDFLTSTDNAISQWDGVWLSAVQQNTEGWSVEIGIPLTLLSYSDKPSQTWGIQFDRGISHNDGWTVWPGKARGNPGITSMYGVLQGVENIPAVRAVEIQPYLLGGTSKAEHVERTGDIGVDLVYPLTADTRISATINPDFGQVEADPSVLNLTAFETFQEERRPFFVRESRFLTGGNEFGAWSKNGQGSFVTHPLMLYNSRRIGGVPDAITPEGGEIIERPGQTGILGAARIFGRTTQGVTYSAVNSVTAATDGRLEIISGTDTLHRQERIEPLTNYLAGRVEKAFINDLSTIGLMFTHVAPQHLPGQAVAAADWRLKLLENHLTIAGQAVLASSAGDRSSGVRVDLRYDNMRWWDLTFKGGRYGQDFDINRLGYLRRSGISGYVLKGGLRQQNPWSIFRRIWVNLNYFKYMRLDRTTLVEEVEIQQQSIFANYWSFEWSMTRTFRSFDDSDTFRDDGAWILARSAGWRADSKLRSDQKRMIAAELTLVGKHFDSGTNMKEAVVELNLRPTDYVKLSIKSTLGTIASEEQWVDIEKEANQTNLIYASSRQKISSHSFRMDLLLSPTLSFQAYYQPFEADVGYTNFKRLLAPKSLAFAPHSYDENPDFISRRASGTFVLRWEYAPGSRFFIVYSLDKTESYADSEGEWAQMKSNAFFVKFDYFFRH